MAFIAVPGEQGGYNVFHSDNGQQVGAPLNSKPMANDQAMRFVQGLHIATQGGKKTLTYPETVELEQKCYSEYISPYDMKVSQREANYTELGGLSGGQACANCRWFSPGSSSCYVVEGQIVPTGVSSLWRAKAQPVEPEPLPVVIVDSGAESLAAKTAPPTPGPATVKTYPLNAAQKALDSVEFESAESGFKVLPGGRWVGWWTNNARDKTGEQFTMQSIDNFIARVDSKQVPYPELWYKHLHIPMGRADSLARVGYLALATGTFYDTPTGQAGRKAYEADQAAGKPKTMSHQFLYPGSLKRNGVIHAFNAFEISPLDKGEEANPITGFGVKSAMKVVLSAEKRAELLDKFGGDNEYVNKLLNFADITSKAMEDAGLDLKSLESLPDLMNFGVKDESAHAAIDQLSQVTLQGMKAIGDTMREIVSDLKSVKQQIDSDQKATNQAVADLKSFVENELSNTPRASRSPRTQVAANNPQVTHLKDQNAAAGKKSDQATPDTPANTGKKSVFDEIIDAAKQVSGN